MPPVESNGVSIVSETGEKFLIPLLETLTKIHAHVQKELLAGNGEVRVREIPSCQIHPIGYDPRSASHPALRRRSIDSLVT